MFTLDLPIVLMGFFGLIFVFVIAKKVTNTPERHLYRQRGSRKEDEHIYVERREQRTPWEMGKPDWRKEDWCSDWEKHPARKRKSETTRK